MSGVRRRVWRIARVAAIAGLVLGSGGAAAWLAASTSRSAGPAPSAAPSRDDPDRSERVSRAGPDEIAVPPAVAEKMGIRTAPVVAATRPRKLPPLQGTLAIDSNRMARVH